MSPAEPATPPGHHELSNPKFGTPPLGIGTTFRDGLDGSFQLKLGISHTRHRVADRDTVVGHENRPPSAMAKPRHCVFWGNREIVQRAGAQRNSMAYQPIPAL